MTTNNETPLDLARIALVDAEVAYHSDSSSRNWQAVEKAQSAVAQLQTKQRIDAEIAAKQATDERAKVRAAKKARLDELMAHIATQNDRAAELGKRIGDAILTAKDLVLVEEPALIELSNAEICEAQAIAESLGENVPLPSALFPFCCAVTASETCQRAMPDGVSPWILSQYAGKYWGNA